MSQIKDLKWEISYLKEQLAEFEESKDEDEYKRRILRDLFDKKMIESEGYLL